MDNIIKASHLTKYFYKKNFLFCAKPTKIVACENINFEVKKGCSLAVLGPNASGKTTLIKMLCGLILPTRGHIQIQGYNLEKQPEKIKKNIGLVLDCERSFYFRLSGFENLLFFGRLFGLNIKETKKRISFLSDLLQMNDFLNTKFMTYSTGTRQKFAIARSLLHSPEILFMDEPTKSLDVEMALFVRNFIQDNLIKKQGKTLIFATHDIDEAIFLAEKIAILKKGWVFKLLENKPFERTTILKALKQGGQFKNG